MEGVSAGAEPSRVPRLEGSHPQTPAPPETEFRPKARAQTEVWARGRFVRPEANPSISLHLARSPRVCVPFNDASLDGRKARRDIGRTERLRAALMIGLSKRESENVAWRRSAPRIDAPRKGDALENRGAEVGSRKVGGAEIHVYKVVPVGGELGGDRYRRNDTLRISERPKKVRGNVQSIEFGVCELSSEEANAENLFIVTRWTLRHRRNFLAVEQLLTNEQLARRYVG